MTPRTLDERPSEMVFPDPNLALWPSVPDLERKITATTRGFEDEPLAMRLGYTKALPFAVYMLIKIQGERDENSVCWIVSRDVIAGAALDGRTAGDGDFWATPYDRKSTMFNFSSPEGRLTVTVSTSQLSRFLLRSLALVPVVDESDAFDVDRLIARFYSNGQSR